MRNEIVNTVVDYLVDIHGGISNPSKLAFSWLDFCQVFIIPELAAMREVVVVMGNNYPNMFQDQGNKGDIKNAVISDLSVFISINQ